VLLRAKLSEPEIDIETSDQTVRPESPAKRAKASRQRRRLR
jgi:hypothetical protein